MHVVLAVEPGIEQSLHGVFEATQAGAMNIEPDAWASAGKSVLARATNPRNRTEGGGSPFPAQVRFQVVHEFPPLPEARFKHILTYKDKAQKIFELLLTPVQVSELMKAFLELQRSRA